MPDRPKVCSIVSFEANLGSYYVYLQHKDRQTETGDSPEGRIYTGVNVNKLPK